MDQLDQTAHVDVFLGLSTGHLTALLVQSIGTHLCGQSVIDCENPSPVTLCYRVWPSLNDDVAPCWSHA